MFMALSLGSPPTPTRQAAEVVETTAAAAAAAEVGVALCAPGRYLPADLLS